MEKINQSLDDYHPENNQDIVSAQVVEVNQKEVIVQTEDHELITVKQPASTKKVGILFIKVMLDILKNGIWIPVNRKLKQFLRYDWFDTPLEDYSF